MSDRELLTAKQIAEEFHMASAAVARGWLQRWQIPMVAMRGHRHEHLYDAERVRRTRREQMAGKRPPEEHP
jgi:hypothetical protein